MKRSREVTALIVDDEPLILALMEESLHRHGWKVLRASHGFEALRRVADSPSIDLVITDLQMPEMGGLELIEQLREKWPELPALLISGFCGDFQALQSELDEQTQFLPKPFDLQTLRQTAEELLDKSPRSAETLCPSQDRSPQPPPRQTEQIG